MKIILDTVLVTKDEETRLYFDLESICSYIDDIDCYDIVYKSIDTPFVIIHPETEVIYITEEVIYNILYQSKNSKMAQCLYKAIYGSIMKNALYEFPSLTELLPNDITLYHTAS